MEGTSDGSPIDAMLERSRTRVDPARAHVFGRVVRNLWRPGDEAGSKTMAKERGCEPHPARLFDSEER